MNRLLFSLLCVALGLASPAGATELVVEVHESIDGGVLWYRVGVVDADAKTISWGNSQRYDSGSTPMVDVYGNIAVAVHQGQEDLKLWCRVGIVDPASKTISWGQSANYDRGRMPTVALNGNVVVEVHQSHTGTNLWYHVGIVDAASKTIAWGNSQRYDRGNLPSIGFSRLRYPLREATAPAPIQPKTAVPSAEPAPVQTGASEFIGRPFDGASWFFFNPDYEESGKSPTFLFSLALLPGGAMHMVESGERGSGGPYLSREQQGSWTWQGNYLVIKVTGNLPMLESGTEVKYAVERPDLLRLVETSQTPARFSHLVFIRKGQRFPWYR